MLKFTNQQKTAAIFFNSSFGLTAPEDWDSIGDGPTRTKVKEWLAAGNTPEPADPEPSGADISKQIKIASLYATVTKLQAKGGEAHKIKQLQTMAASIAATLSTSVSAPTWSSSAAYSVGDRVTHDGFVWIATTANTGNAPDYVPGDWDIFDLA